MSRVQLALNVDDIDEAITFYSKLFATEPAKIKPGYANFAIAEPPLKLILIENPGHGGSLNHLGVEVASTEDVAATTARLSDEGLATATEDQVTCCYAAAGQGVGRRPERRTVGDLHGPRRRRDTQWRAAHRRPVVRARAV